MLDVSVSRHLVFDDVSEGAVVLSDGAAGANQYIGTSVSALVLALALVVAVALALTLALALAVAPAAKLLPATVLALARSACTLSRDC
jgi:hypothetical protein